MTNPWTTLSTKEVYANPWIRVREDDILNPAGKPGIYGVVEYRNRAVGVVPVDDDGFTWLVGQYRYCHDTYESRKRPASSPPPSSPSLASSSSPTPPPTRKPGSSSPGTSPPAPPPPRKRKTSKSAASL